MSQPRALIIAGPNGAGKSTFAKEFLPKEGNLTIFINADLIAAGLSPFRPEDAAVKAMRLMAEEMRLRVEQRIDFAIESTLAGRSYVSLIKGWKQQGYGVKILPPPCERRNFLATSQTSGLPRRPQRSRRND